ncbi:uncharacterized protein LOC125665258, partial [Ostrea edulis]|uniref:uncharacterized protein LOC125665258 n=1 Tax=Ostrea edulis TaxID=37623 RepID=UPI0024AEF278
LSHDTLIYVHSHYLPLSPPYWILISGRIHSTVSAWPSCLHIGRPREPGYLQYCTALSWRAWGNCEGNCGKQTLQTRKRTICYDSDEIYLRISMPITRQKVLNFCNITQPTVETRLCKQCIFGKFNVTANACEICKNITCSAQLCKHGICYDTNSSVRCDCYDGFAGLDCSIELTKDFKLPTWLPWLEYALLAIISMVILMATGCICLKCCVVCGCMTSDEEEKKKRKKMKEDIQQEHYSLKPKSVIDF